MPLSAVSVIVVAHPISEVPEGLMNYLVFLALESNRTPVSEFVLFAVLTIFIHLVVCLTTGPKPLPKPALHIVRSRASSFK